jgi:hypothetical protein
MSDLHTIHQLLREEYAASKHIFWLDEASGKVVNDVSYTLGLIGKTAQCLRRGNEVCWKQLVAYCIERSMSYILMFAIGEYLSDCAKLEPLPLIDLSYEPVRNWRGGLLPLFDETDRVASKGVTAKPEPDREMAFKHEHRWSQYQLRMKDDHPAPERMGTTSKSIHWLF